MSIWGGEQVSESAIRVHLKRLLTSLLVQVALRTSLFWTVRTSRTLATQSWKPEKRRSAGATFWGSKKLRTTSSFLALSARLAVPVAPRSFLRRPSRCFSTHSISLSLVNERRSQRAALGCSCRQE